VTTYIIVRYQKHLDLKGSAWITFATCLVMLILAIDAGLNRRFESKHIVGRQLLMLVWGLVQVL
jgi:hypothetical protein